jgi:hypothetical protein
MYKLLNSVTEAQRNDFISYCVNKTVTNKLQDSTITIVVKPEIEIIKRWTDSMTINRFIGREKHDMYLQYKMWTDCYNYHSTKITVWFNAVLDIFKEDGLVYKMPIAGTTIYKTRVFMIEKVS